MEKNAKLGRAFLDIAFTGVIGVTIALLFDLIGGDGINLWLVGAGVLTYGAFFIGAVRLGESPARYLRFVGRRGQPPQ